MYVMLRFHVKVVMLKFPMRFQNGYFDATQCVTRCMYILGNSQEEKQTQTRDERHLIGADLSITNTRPASLLAENLAICTQ